MHEDAGPEVVAGRRARHHRDRVGPVALEAPPGGDRQVVEHLHAVLAVRDQVEPLLVEPRGAPHGVVHGLVHGVRRGVGERVAEPAGLHLGPAPEDQRVELVGPERPLVRELGGLQVVPQPVREHEVGQLELQADAVDRKQADGAGIQRVQGVSLGPRHDEAPLVHAVAAAQPQRHPRHQPGALFRGIHVRAQERGGSRPPDGGHLAAEREVDRQALAREAEGAGHPGPHELAVGLLVGGLEALARDAPVVVAPAAGGGRLELPPAQVPGLDAHRHAPRPRVAGDLRPPLDAAPEPPVQGRRRAADRLEPRPLQVRRPIELRPESGERQPVGQEKAIADGRAAQPHRGRLAHAPRPARAHAGHPPQEGRERAVAGLERVEVLHRRGEPGARPEQAVPAAQPDLDVGGAAQREVAANRDVGDHRDRERGLHRLLRIVDGGVVEPGLQPLEPVVAVAVGHRRHHRVGQGEGQPQALDRYAGGGRHGPRQRPEALGGRGGGDGPADEGESGDAGADA